MRQRIRVGIADDDSMSRFIIGRTLQGSEDIQVNGDVADGRAAVELAQTGTIDVLILDLEMPNMKGDEALRLIRKLAPEVRVVVRSSLPASSKAAEMLAAGAAAYLEKPTHADRLLQTVREAARFSTPSQLSPR